MIYKHRRLPFRDSNRKDKVFIFNNLQERGCPPGNHIKGVKHS
jgi:hypothetical protein